MSRTTMRRILVNAGLSSPRRRRPPKHRVRRQRMPREGMLIQMDGSYHRWLGEDGPQFTILFAVDDATGCVPGALFCDHEDTSSYFLLMQGMIRRRCIPLVLYTDRHAVFKHRSEYHPAGTPTQFGRAMEELGTQLIFALSPQAKGRVERTAGTFQDRPITELRLAGATTVEQAKAVLQQFLPGSSGVLEFRPSAQSRRSGPWVRSRVGADPVFQAPPESGAGQHREILQAHPVTAAHSATPERWSWCWRGWTVGCHYSMRDASSPPRKRRPVRHLSAAATRLSQLPPSQPLYPELASKLSVAALELPGAKPDQEEDAHFAAIDDPDAAGLRVVASPRRPTFLKQERWKAVQQAKLQGMSIRRMAMELGIHRDTVRRYIDAESPPTRRTPATPPAPASDTIAD